MNGKFLPDDYTPPTSESVYLAFKEDGDYTFRILSDSIVGYELWVGGKPQRRPMDKPFTDEEIAASDKPKNGEKGVTHFMAFAVLHDGKVKILEVRQVTVQREIARLFRDEDWGDPKNYNLLVSRTSKGGKVTYTVSPKPHKKLSEEKAELWESTLKAGFNLEALFSGGNPFGAKTAVATDEEDDKPPFIEEEEEGLDSDKF